MSAIFKSRIVKIGNSHGIRIPKLLLEQAGLGSEVEMEAQDDQLVIRAAHGPRAGWDEQFKLMAKSGDDKLLDGAPSLTQWDDKEWTW